MRQNAIVELYLKSLFMNVFDVAENYCPINSASAGVVLPFGGR